MRRGFTLIELLMMLAVVGLCTALVFASVAGVGERGRLEQTLRRIGDTYTAARSGAICTSRPMRVRYDLRQGEMTVLEPGDGLPAAVVRMPDGVRMVAVEPAEGEGGATIGIAATGLGRSHTVTLETADGFSGSVVINGLTGRTEVTMREAK